MIQLEDYIRGITLFDLWTFVMSSIFNMMISFNIQSPSYRNFYGNEKLLIQSSLTFRFLSWSSILRIISLISKYKSAIFTDIWLYSLLFKQPIIVVYFHDSDYRIKYNIRLTEIKRQQKWGHLILYLCGVLI